MIAKINKFCKTPELIENYNVAVSDSKGWVCHHRLEDFGFSSEELKSLGLYYDRPFWELKYYSKTMHSMHHKALAVQFANYIRNTNGTSNNGK